MLSRANLPAAEESSDCPRLRSLTKANVTALLDELPGRHSAGAEHVAYFTLIFLFSDLAFRHLWSCGYETLCLLAIFVYTV